MCSYKYTLEVASRQRKEKPGSVMLPGLLKSCRTLSTSNSYSIAQPVLLSRKIEEVESPGILRYAE